VKIRIAAATAVIGALFLSMSGAQAATPVMDGKKVKVLNVKANGGLQDHDSNQVTGLVTGPEAVDCAPPLCTRLTFVYKPAKGAKGGLLFSMTWGNPLSDFDLYVAEVSKGANTEIAHCATIGPPSEKVFLPAASLKSGKTYAMVIYHFRSINDVATGKVEMGVPSTIKTTIPAKADDLINTNCAL
jgi:hypothetical protein